MNSYDNDFNKNPVSSNRDFYLLNDQKELMNFYDT